MPLKDLIANFYEFWGGAYLGPFSDDMYSIDQYFPIAIYSIITAIVITVTYYYVLDRPATAKKRFWLLALLVGGILSFVIAYVTSNNGLTEMFTQVGVSVPPGYTSDMLQFSLINVFWTIILILLLSLLLKWKSTHSSYIPF